MRCCALQAHAAAHHFCHSRVSAVPNLYVVTRYNVAHTQVRAMLQKGSHAAQVQSSMLDLAAGRLAAHALQFNVQTSKSVLKVATSKMGEHLERVNALARTLAFGMPRQSTRGPVWHNLNRHRLDTWPKAGADPQHAADDEYVASLGLSMSMHAREHPVLCRTAPGIPHQGSVRFGEPAAAAIAQRETN